MQVWAVMHPEGDIWMDDNLPFAVFDSEWEAEEWIEFQMLSMEREKDEFVLVPATLDLHKDEVDIVL